MRRIIATILLLAIFGTSAISIAQERELDYVWDPFMPIKGAFVDVSVGEPGFGVGIGARYFCFGLNLGLIGLANSSPAYALQHPPGVVINRNQPLPQGFEEDKFLSTLITADALVYADVFEKISFNASVGFFSRNDSILAKRIDTGSRYIYKNETNSGLCFGVGAEYVLNESLNIGAGFHTERGAVIRFTYLWF